MIEKHKKYGWFGIAFATLLALVAMELLGTRGWRVPNAVAIVMPVVIIATLLMGRAAALLFAAVGSIYYLQFYRPVDGGWSAFLQPAGEISLAVLAAVGLAGWVQGRLLAERKVAQKTLDGALAAVTDAFVTLDDKWRFTYVNRKAEELWSKRREDLLGRSVWECFPELEGSETQRRMLEAAERDEAVKFETHSPVLHRWIELSACPVERGMSVYFHDITNRKQAEQALRESRERQRFILEAARVGTWEWDIETGQVTWSGNMEELRGISPGTFIGTYDAFVERIHPGDRPKVAEAIEQALAGDGLAHIEYREPKADGGVRWVEGKGRVVRCPETGKPLRMVGICSEVTERKRNEAAVRALADAGTALTESLDEAKTLANVANILVPAWADWCVIDLLREDGRIENVGVGHIDPDKASLARRLREIQPPRVDDSNGVGHTIRTGESQCFPEISDDLLRKVSRTEEYLRILKTLGLRSAIVVPLRARGRTLGALTLVGATVEHRFSEANLPHVQELARRCALAVDNARLYRESQHEIRQRKQTELALRESEAWFRQAVDAMAVGVYATDADGRLLRYNDEAARIWGRSPQFGEAARERFCGSYRLRTANGKLVSHDRCAVAQAIRENRPMRNVEVIVEHEDGTQVTVLANPSPIRDDKGHVIGAINCLIDITARKQAEQQLKHFNEALEQRVAERTAELGHRANQLRRLAGELNDTEQRERKRLAQVLHDDHQQLLVAAKMHASMLLREQAKQNGEGEGARRLLSLLDEAIESSRSLSHELSPHVLHTDGLAAALNWLAPRKQEKFGLKLHVDIDEQAEPQREDVRAFLFQAARELLVNVAKHSGSHEAWVRLRRHGSSEVELVVEDHGVGFDEQDPSATEPKGFGLFGMRERLALLGGQLIIDAQPGRGTRVILRAPRIGLASNPTSLESAYAPRP